jgi:hypothetical protein
MAIVLMNGDVTGVTYPVNTWGELLAVLDAQSISSGVVVAGVRLGGVDVLAFRTQEVLSQTLDAEAEVLIETARPADLILQTLDEAEAATHAIVEAAVALGCSYRAPDVSAANRSLPEFAESLGTLIVVTDTLAQGAGVDLSTIGDGGLSAVQMIDELLAHTNVLLAAQRAGDWTQVANVIESDIAASVRRWPLVLQTIRRAAPLLRDVA